MEVLGPMDHKEDVVSKRFSDFRDKQVYAWTAAGGSGTGVTASHGVVASVGGTATTATADLTTRYKSLRRVEYLVTSASTSAIAFLRFQSLCAIGVSGYGCSGFDFTMRSGPCTGVATTTTRYFMGLKSPGSPTDVQPSSLTSIIGVGYDAADTNLQMMHNDGSGTATKIDLGGSFPVPTADRTEMYQLDLYCVPGGSSVDYKVTDLITLATSVGTISSDLPAATTFLTACAYLSVGGTSSVVGIAVMDLFIETSR